MHLSKVGFTFIRFKKDASWVDPLNLEMYFLNFIFLLFNVFLIQTVFEVEIHIYDKIIFNVRFESETGHPNR